MPRWTKSQNIVQLNKYIDQQKLILIWRTKSEGVQNATMYRVKKADKTTGWPKSQYNKKIFLYDTVLNKHKVDTCTHATHVHPLVADCTGPCV